MHNRYVYKKTLHHSYLSKFHMAANQILNFPCETEREPGLRERILAPSQIPCAFPAAAAAKSLQSCPTLCDPIDGSPPGSPSLGFSRQEHWSALPFPSPMHVLVLLKMPRSMCFFPCKLRWILTLLQNKKPSMENHLLEMDRIRTHPPVCWVS